MSNQVSARAVTRRAVLGASFGAVAALAGTAMAARAQDGATPAASPVAGEWTWTDVFGTTITLPEPPKRIAANLATAAALWDLGIKPVAVFDWTASAHPDGDHIAWGNIDAKAVANIGDIDGNILPEELLKVAPDIILTQTFDNASAESLNGVLPDQTEALSAIAPILVATNMDPTDQQLQRLVDLAESLGADLDDPGIVSAREAYEAKVEEFRATAADQADLTVLFMDFDPTAIYIGGPQGVAELAYLQSLGLQFANADAPTAADFWEELSPEQANTYPADIIYNDVYSTLKTLGELRGTPVFAQMPAIAAGQVGLWERDFPVSYAGLTDFLETVLVTLRDAEKVS
ncbi:MAG: ABC transporter substrate-binding protein [Thermomicrobiales bacterium]